MTLSDKFHELYSQIDENPGIASLIFRTVSNAPDSAERDGLLGLIYHEGIGVDADLDKAFEYAEKATSNGNKDGLGYFLLGYMCDNAETPDQAEGGSRQKYDHYDAESFYELSSQINSRWQDEAILWLGDYYMDFAKGGDPEIGVEYYEKIADHNAIAAGELSDYFWNLVMPEYLEDKEWREALFKWTEVAYRHDPEEYAYRLAWLYADGIGCDVDSEKAKKLFKESYDSGDYRGAQAIATMLDDYLEKNPGISEDEKRAIEKQIEEWNKKKDEMYARQLTESIEELDQTIEED